MGGTFTASVLHDLGRLKRHVPAGFFSDLARPVDRDVFTLDIDRSVLLHRNLRAATLDDDLVASVDHEILADFPLLVVADLSLEVLADLELLVLADGGGAVVADRRRPIRPDARRLALAVSLRLAQAYRLRLGCTNRHRLRGAHRHLPGRADVDHLVHADGVRTGQEHADRLVLQHGTRPVAADGYGLVL